MNLFLIFFTLVFSVCTQAQIKVGVIDTGVFPHDDLKMFLKDGISFVDDNTNDDHDHGTYVAGTIVRDSVVKNIEIYPIKNMKYNEKTKKFVKNPSLYLKESIDFAIEKKINILNISQEYNVLEPDVFLAIKKAQKYGIIIVAAAGNEIKELTTENSVYPCQYGLDNVICVGAYGFSKDKIKLMSNYGKTSVDVFAPGGDILGINKSNTYSIMSGSSVATPQVTALIVREWSKNPKMPYSKVISLIKNKMKKSDDMLKYSKTGLIIPY